MEESLCLRFDLVPPLPFLLLLMLRSSVSRLYKKVGHRAHLPCRIGTLLAVHHVRPIRCPPPRQLGHLQGMLKKEEGGIYTYISKIGHLSGMLVRGIVFFLSSLPPSSPLEPVYKYMSPSSSPLEMAPG